MGLPEELKRLQADPAGDRRGLYAALLGATLWVRQPERVWLLVRPGGRERAVPAFLTEAEAITFWARTTPGQTAQVEPVGLPALAAEARRVGALLVDPEGAALLLDRGELAQLAGGDIPGEFAVWLKGWGRLQHQPAEVLARLRRSHVHVLTSRGEGVEPRLYLLEKSEDGTLAVPCFSSPESLAQFAQVRRLFEGGGEQYAVALVEGEYCLRAAAGLGAYLLVDAESPWEVQLEPTLLL